MRRLLGLTMLLVLGGAVLTVSELTRGVPAPAQAAGGQSAVAYQLDAQHSGFIAFSPALQPPLTKQWSVDLVGSVSYPLIANGRVFVTVANTAGYGTKLYALDELTGQNVWGPIDISGTYFWSNAAYDQGQMFVVNFDGLLRAFDAATGVQAWSVQLPGQYAFTSPPTAAKGTVYVGGAGSGGTLYAVKETTGAVHWSRSVENGDHSSPAFSSDGVYVSYVCPQAYGFAPKTGAPLWHYSGNCSGGGGRTPVLFKGRLYVRDFVNPPGYVLDGGTGALLGRFDADPAPAFMGKRGFSLNAGTLQGWTISNGKVKWSFAGDGTLSTAPIVVNQMVYVGATSGRLYAVNVKTGHEAWSTNVGASISIPDEHNVSQPLTGLGAGDGMIVVPAGHLLVAYR